MSPHARLVVASILLLFCVFISCILFSTTRHITDLQAYAVGFTSLLFASTALLVLYPERARMSYRLYATFAGLLAAFWALETFGGLGWYILDKLARHYQK